MSTTAELTTEETLAEAVARLGRNWYSARTVALLFETLTDDERYRLGLAQLELLVKDARRAHQRDVERGALRAAEALTDDERQQEIERITAPLVVSPEVRQRRVAEEAEWSARIAKQEVVRQGRARARWEKKCLNWYETHTFAARRLAWGPIDGGEEFKQWCEETGRDFEAWLDVLVGEDREHRRGGWDFRSPGERMAAYMAEYREAIRLEVTEELLGTEFSLGDGRRVTWREATTDDHEQRIRMLQKMAVSTLETAALHQDAVRLISDSKVKTLGDLAPIPLATGVQS